MLPASRQIAAEKMSSTFTSLRHLSHPNLNYSLPNYPSSNHARHALSLLFYWSPMPLQPRLPTPPTAHTISPPVVTSNAVHEYDLLALRSVLPPTKKSLAGLGMFLGKEITDTIITIAVDSSVRAVVSKIPKPASLSVSADDVELFGAYDPATTADPFTVSVANFAPTQPTATSVSFEAMVTEADESVISNALAAELPLVRHVLDYFFGPHERSDGGEMLFDAVDSDVSDGLSID